MRVLKMFTALIIFILAFIGFQNESDALFRIKHGHAIAGCEEEIDDEGPAVNPEGLYDNEGKVIGITANCGTMETWCIRRVCDIDGLYYEANDDMLIPPGMPTITRWLIDLPPSSGG